MSPKTLAAVVQAEALGVQPSDPATFDARMSAMERQVRALHREIASLRALHAEREVNIAAELARYRRELGIQEAA